MGVCVGVGVCITVRMGSYHIRLYVCTLEYSEGSLYHFTTEHIILATVHTLFSLCYCLCVYCHPCPPSPPI